MKILAFILFMLFLNISMFGTNQIPDKIIYNGDTLDLYTTPLDSYLEKKELKDFNFRFATGAIRGYSALWELKNDSLFLRAIYTIGDSSKFEDQEKLLIRNFGSKDVFAKWYTGELSVAQGKIQRNYEIGWSNQPEEYALIKINKGKQKNITILKNENFRK